MKQYLLKKSLKIEEIQSSFIISSSSIRVYFTLVVVLFEKNRYIVFQSNVSSVTVYSLVNRSLCFNLWQPIQLISVNQPPLNACSKTSLPPPFKVGHWVIFKCDNSYPREVTVVLEGQVIYVVFHENK